MAIHRRKLQRVAGSTYTISLPKAWVMAQRLAHGQDLAVIENDDKTLTIAPEEPATGGEDGATITYDDHSHVLEQVLLATYYKGYEAITIKSKEQLPDQARHAIRKTLQDLSGAEVVHESPESITVAVMLKKDTIDIHQVFYRIHLILHASLSTLLNKMDWQEIELNEDEIDRLYNLTVKLITGSLTDTALLKSTGIHDVTLIPSLFLLGKRYENLADTIKNIAGLTYEGKADLEEARPLLQRVLAELKRCSRYLAGKQEAIFTPMTAEEEQEDQKLVDGISHRQLRVYAQEAYRYLVNIEEELVTTSYYRKLARE